MVDGPTKDDAAHRCRVCALLLAEPPWGSDGRTPLFDICPCCGVEFGYEDATVTGVRRFRDAWLDSGARWQDPSTEPESWDLAGQLERIPEEFRP